MPTTTINLTGQALSKVDDTNVTLTLGGTPLTALLKATTITVGWTGTLADARIASAATWNAKESALTFSTGLTRTVNTVTIDSTVVTLTGAQALSNKTGLISQWTNDSGYLTSLAGAVTSVGGTLNRVTSTGGATPVIDIDANYVGQNSITTLGTIGTGTWQGTVIGKAYGGTGVNIASAALVLGTASTTAGQLTLSNATNAFTQTLRGTNPAASIIYDLPTTAPTLGQVLSATAPAAGVVTLSWATASSGITIGGTAITSGTDYRVLFQDATASDYVTQTANFTMGAVATGVLDVPTGYAIGGSIFARYSLANTSLSVGYNNINPASYVGNTCFGISAGAGITSVANTAIGDRALISAAGAFNTALGYRALGSTTGSRNLGLGGETGFSITSGSYNIVIGNENLGGNFSSSISIGQGGTSNTITADHQGVLGTANANGYISDWYFNGVTHTAPYSVTLNASGASGSNVAGCTYTHAGSKGTGSGTPGTLVFKTSTTLGSGTTLQSLVSRLTISGGAVTTDASTATWADALDFVFGTTTGTKIGTGTTQKIGFWNATPLAQQTTASAASTFVANTSLIANDTATFDGYTLGQVVKILRNLGILA